MIYNLKIVCIDVDYCNYLRKYDNRVSYNYGVKENSPYIGVLFKINNLEYFAPLSSPKAKHLKLKNSVDFLRLDGGKLGAINFNNMIPVTNNNYVQFDFNKKNKTKEEIKYITLLQNQLDFLNKNNHKIIRMSIVLYNLYRKDKLPTYVKKRCCNYPLLEEKCTKYNNSKILQEV